MRCKYPIILIGEAAAGSRLMFFGTVEPPIREPARGELTGLSMGGTPLAFLRRRKGGMIMKTLDKLLVALIASGLIGAALPAVTWAGLSRNHNETFVRDTGRKAKQA
jgi:hypothetical protein